MSNIGKLFKIGGNKAPRPPRRDYDENRSSSEGSEDDESYLDPQTVHPTSSPNSTPVQMPSYPPPRPNHSPANRRVHDAGKRASVPVTFDQMNKPPVPKARSQRPQSAEHLKPGKGPIASQRLGLKIPGDDYSDPWDAKKAQSPGGDYSDPWDAKKAQPPADDYCDPWDKKPTPTDPTRKTSKDDYIDPWDARQDGSTQVEMTQTTEKSKRQSSEDSDEESYDEPYDLGKVTALDEQAKRFSLKGMRPSSIDGSPEHEERSIRKNIDYAFESAAKKQQTPSKDIRPADDYDSPWESKSFLGMKQTSPSLPQEKSQAPVSDTRPADDYDKPWEWNKKTHLNGHMQPPKQHEPLQSPKADARPADDYDAPWEWSKSGQVASMVKGKEGESRGGANAPPPKPPRVFTEGESAVDPSLPLEQQGWYHGPLKRLEAEKLLQTAEDCSFLLRNSESSKNDFSLSVRNNNTFMHLKIVSKGDKYILGQFSKPFDTVPEMIHYYSVNKLNIRGAEHKKLLHPVVQAPEYFTIEPPRYSTAM